MMGILRTTPVKSSPTTSQKTMNPTNSAPPWCACCSFLQPDKTIKPKKKRFLRWQLKLSAPGTCACPRRRAACPPPPPWSRQQHAENKMGMVRPETKMQPLVIWWRGSRWVKNGTFGSRSAAAAGAGS